VPQRPEDSTTDAEQAGDDDVVIHYHRPPDRNDLYVQKLVHESSDVIVTFLEQMSLSRVISIDGEVALENGSPVVWFTFPGAHHDIGRFHRADGRHTGIYANVIEPVDIVSRNEWRTTDLFLDVWVGWSGRAQLLDEDELHDALLHGWVSDETARTARDEAKRLMDAARAREWPPAVVAEWTLERVRCTLKDRAV
jgi:predicted RNA-binding protein associated with RNAse of E/G family